MSNSASDLELDDSLKFPLLDEAFDLIECNKSSNDEDMDLALEALESGMGTSIFVSLDQEETNMDEFGQVLDPSAAGGGVGRARPAPISATQHEESNTVGDKCTPCRGMTATDDVSRLQHQPFTLQQQQQQ
eukprot:scpid102513/ scgid5164/ 